MNWLKELVAQHEELESPQSFWYWSGLCAISAVIKDQVWLDRHAYRLYPNIYVILHADSGLKKGPPVGLAKSLVRRVNNTRIINGRSSIQGILKELGTAYTVPGGRAITKSVGFIVASEFSSSIVADPSALTILTDLYDRQYNAGSWRSLLKMETFELKDPTISLLVATNDAHFSDFLEDKDIHGGFIGRTFMIAESQVHRLNPLIKPLKKQPDHDKLAEYLKKIASLNGPFKPLNETTAGQLYETWYYNFYRTAKDQEVKDETGIVQRLGDHVLKVAMLLSMAEDGSLIITEDQMTEAIYQCERLLGNVRKTTHGKKGMAQNKNQKALIINELLQRDNHEITREMLMKKYWMNFNATELSEIMEGFHIAKLILTESKGNVVVYKMPTEIADKLKRRLEGKNE